MPMTAYCGLDCGEYPCDELEQFFGFVPSARETLDSLRDKS